MFNKTFDNSVFKVGKVISVEGRTVKILVDKLKNTSNSIYNGTVIKNVSVGGYVKIIKGFTEIIGKVDGEYISEDKFFSGKYYKSDKEKIIRIIEVKMLGFFDAKNEFKRGIKELPLIDNECFLLTGEEFGKVHNFIRDGDKPIELGVLSLEKGQPIKVGINSLFASHFGIFGNTGSGKSYTLASIYRKLFLKYKDEKKFRANARFFLLDFNGEYIKENAIIEDKYKNKYELSTRLENGKDKFPVKNNTINDPSFWAIFLTATEKTQAPFIKRTLRKNIVQSNNIEELIRKIIISGDKKIDQRGLLVNFLWSIKEFLSNNINIDNLTSKLQYNSTANVYYIKINEKKTIYSDSNYEAVISEIKKVLLGAENKKFMLKNNLGYIDNIYLKFLFFYFQEIVWGYSIQEHLAPLIKRLDKRINDLKKVITIKDNRNQETKFITIVSLKDVNLDMKKVLPLLICKQLYDEKKKENNKKKYLNIIIDEAHNILSYASRRESEIWKDYRLETFEEIIKEGRKFGVFLTIASQRPADISSTIISQLHNYFLHRLINDRDIQAIEKTISYLDKVSSEYLPILPTGTCVLAGVLAQVPVIIDIDEIPSVYEPDNKTINLVKNWGKEHA